jgi:hypothetical protein
MTIDEMIKLLSSQKHKKFIKQLDLVNTKKMMNEANWDSKLCEKSSSH